MVYFLLKKIPSTNNIYDSINIADIYEKPTEIKIS